MFKLLVTIGESDAAISSVVIEFATRDEAEFAVEAINKKNREVSLYYVVIKLYK